MARVEINQGGREADVTSDHELLVTLSDAPVFTPQKTRPFRRFFTIDGIASGDNDMGQDGSVNELEFYIPADNKEDIYITHVSIILGYGASGQPFLFGDLSALINGIRFYYRSQSGEVDVHDAIHSNQDLLRLSSARVNASWELRGIGSMNDYGYFITIPLTHFSPNNGVKLDAGSTQKIAFIVRDTMAAVSGVSDTFNAIAHGFCRFK